MNPKPDLVRLLYVNKDKVYTDSSIWNMPPQYSRKQNRYVSKKNKKQDELTVIHDDS